MELIIQHPDVVLKPCLVCGHPGVFKQHPCQGKRISCQFYVACTNSACCRQTRFTGMLSHLADEWNNTINLSVYHQWEYPRSFPHPSLKPCPCCGGRAVASYSLLDRAYITRCGNSYCGAYKRYSKTLDDALLKWNERDDGVANINMIVYKGISIKDCPCCGSAPTIVDGRSYFRTLDSEVKCSQYLCGLTVSGKVKDFNILADRWNKRPEETRIATLGTGGILTT